MDQIKNGSLKLTMSEDRKARAIRVKELAEKAGHESVLSSAPRKRSVDEYYANCTILAPALADDVLALVEENEALKKVCFMNQNAALTRGEENEKLREALRHANLLAEGLSRPRNGAASVVSELRTVLSVALAPKKEDEK